jgi:hypothetical protein
MGSRQLDLCLAVPETINSNNKFNLEHKEVSIIENVYIEAAFEVLESKHETFCIAISVATGHTRGEPRTVNKQGHCSRGRQVTRI